MDGEPQLVSVPCTVKRTATGWACWSCGQPAPYLNQHFGRRGATSAFARQGTPIRHLGGCSQVAVADHGRDVMDVPESNDPLRQAPQEYRCPGT